MSGKLNFLNPAELGQKALNLKEEHPALAFMGTILGGLLGAWTLTSDPAILQVVGYIAIGFGLVAIASALKNFGVKIAGGRYGLEGAKAFYQMEMLKSQSETVGFTSASHYDRIAKYIRDCKKEGKEQDPLVIEHILAIAQTSSDMHADKVALINSDFDEFVSHLGKSFVSYPVSEIEKELENNSEKDLVKEDIRDKAEDIKPVHPTPDEMTDISENPSQT